MIVRKDKIESVVSDLKKCAELGLDTETTGLSETDRIFSLIISTDKTPYYFNFQHYDGINPEFILPRSVMTKDLVSLFQDPDKLWFIHNAKFDMRMLSYESIDCVPRGTIHCTQVNERLIKNNYPPGSYSLKKCADRRGWEKLDEVEKYISKNKLFKWVNIPGKKRRAKDKFYYKVPFNITAKYGERDGHLHILLGKSQIESLKSLQRKKEAHFLENPHLDKIIENERKLTKVIFDMERRGIKIDKNYVKAAWNFETDEYDKYVAQFEKISGCDFKDSPSALAEAFAKTGAKLSYTEKGNPTFADGVLKKMGGELASCLRKIRKHYKYSGTYYSSFLYYSHKDTIHTTFNQGGTDTGRFSSSNPNLQNIPKEESFDGLRYVVRKCFVPRKDHCFVMIDYDQQEFRMMLDYAGEKELIKKINDGHDVHQATADELNKNDVGVDRTIAKKINFLLLYGGGPRLLADELGVDLTTARNLMDSYFRNFPGIRRLFDNIVRKSKTRGFILNWAGRVYHRERNREYAMVNHLIQGGCAEVLKFAMTNLHDYLKDKKSAMLAQVHDELLFEVHKDELHIVQDLKNIMESIYPCFNNMKLTCSVEHSWVSWGSVDKKEGYPHEQATGDSV